MAEDNIKIAIRDLDVYYHDRPVLQKVNMVFRDRELTAIVGPSGCGKSTLLMVLNRLLDTVPHARVEGSVKLRSNDQGWLNVLRLGETDLPSLRRKVGLVFQHPNVLPTSIFKNVAFPLRLLGLSPKKVDAKVRSALVDLFLWDEVKDRLDSPASELSGGQQQRLCLARTLVLQPEILLLDEPTSFLDQALAQKIEALLLRLKDERTVVVVSHYNDQVMRLSDNVYRLVGNRQEPG
ncbi:MAG: ATP-binding cassette domain-containing protein [Deltaproteobacteria bacterium]|nr:ATP-binding cassette domain-containing protein [Deltaproteobacteria bacterium]